MKRYNIWDVRLNRNTYNWCGSEWIIDGENNINTFPGAIPECMARKLYSMGLSYSPIIEVCQGCDGKQSGKYCRFDEC